MRLFSHSNGRSRRISGPLRRTVSRPILAAMACVAERIIRAAFGAGVVLVLSRPAAAELLIKRPGAHPDYVLELEPHALLEPFEKDLKPGVGVRATIEVFDNGFVKTINNTVGVGFGLDWADERFTVPIVMQWNFWLSRHWSVFGEPGGALRFGKGDTKPKPYIAGGARLHFNDYLALTLRAGYPSLSVGVSFLF